MATVVEHVKIKAEPMLMRRWYKEAKLLRDENGRMQIWEPPPPEDNKEKAHA